MSKGKLFSFITLMSLSVCYADDNLNVAESAYADNQVFQDFDNQFYIGYGMGNGNTKNSYGQKANYATNDVAFGVEKLFDMGIWLAFNGTLMTQYNNLSSNPNAVSDPVGQDPAIADLDLKVGYAFPVLKDTLLLTPYGLLGRNTNISSNSLQDNNSSSSGTSTITVNSTQDYFLSTGLGGRLEYRLDKIFDFYFDQNVVYNIDMSHPTSQYAPMTNVSFTSILGAKFNVWRELQLGAQTYYNYSALTNGLTTPQQYDLIPQNYFGGMITVGLTY